VIRLENVTKTYAVGAGVYALRAVDLHIRPNDYVAVVGPSGSGKSTLLHLVGLLDAPTSGRVLFDGRDTARMDDGELSRLRGRSIGFVFQSFHLIPHLSVLENVEMPLFYQSLSPHARRRAARRQIAAVGLSHREHHLPRQLSGGECQRAAIARALAPDPGLILADEPTGNLDSHNGSEILAIFDGLHRQGKTLMVITHDTALAGRIPRSVRMADGRVLEVSPP
jgi:putative ABC transport system ATP-binding protein